MKEKHYVRNTDKEKQNVKHRVILPQTDATDIPYMETFFSVLVIKYLCNFWRYSDSLTGPLKLWMKIAAEL